MNILRFSVPGVAAEAVNVRTLEASGRAAGVASVRLTYQLVYRPAGDRNEYRCRVTCSAQMAVFVIEELRIAESEAEQRGDSRLAAACARAIRETFVALMTTRRSRRADGATNDGTTQAGAGRRGR